MASQKTTSRSSATSGFVVGRARFEKISAVEGIKLSAAMKGRISESDRKGLSADERRAVIIRSYRKD